MIPDETIEQVRDSADIVGLIGESVQLKRTGTDYRGPCPFHGGTHRNFTVIPKKGRYYCFVCHESGDVFSWLMKRFGMDYPGAVREIARRTGILIPDRPGRAGPDPHEPLYGAVAAAHDWFTRQLLELPEAKVAREYLEGRDIPLDTAAMLGLGYAPVGKVFLTAMTELGIDERVLVQAGLAAQRDDGQVSPRFRGRLLFPIHDLRGRAVGFGGRLLGPGEPKYLNSPETEIFHKGKQLYNLHLAKMPIRKEEMVIVVEGYFDVLRLVLAGVEHVVAPLGTALTADQAVLLKRFVKEATLLYDSDRAGLQATFRAGDELLRHGIRVRVATLPPGEDPDTLVRKGGVEALEPVLRDDIDLFERKIQLLERAGWFEGFDRRRDAVDRLLPTIRAAADPITRELYLSLASQRSGVSKDVLEDELRQG
jgi:DNA primase